MKITLAILLVAYSVTGCRQYATDPCLMEAKKWNWDAAANLILLEAAIEEIKSHDSIFSPLLNEGIKEIDSDDFGDSAGIEHNYGINLPGLRRWLKKTKTQEEWRYIKIDGEIITASYKSCRYIAGFFSQGYYYGTLYHSPAGFGNIPKTSSETVDTLSLGDQWYYVLTDCKGCGE